MNAAEEAHQRKWDRRFLALAEVIATWSKDPSTQTGCVVVDEDRAIVATGYNGFPRGVRDTQDRYENRELKYQLVAHCDSNAVFSAARRGVSLAGATMYLTGPPCNECTKAIIQAGITRVAWPRDNKFEQDEATRARWASSIGISEQMAEEAGVEFTRVP